MANEIEKATNDLPEEYVYKTYTKVIKDNDSSLNIPFDDILNKVLSFVDVSDILENVQKGTEYVVQIPKEFQKQVDSGEYWIMKNKVTGKEWPTLMRMGDDGKSKIVTPLSIKKESFVQGNPVQDLTQQFQMAQLQSSIQEQNELLESICKTVKHIQKGQMNDRIALLDSGRDQIYFGMQRDDSDPGKRMTIEAGITNMITARNQIFEELKLECEEFESVPKSKFLRLTEEIVHSDYYEDKSNEYNQIYDLYELYKEATKYIAAAHILINQPQLVDSVYQNSLSKLETIDYSNVKSIAYLEPHNEVSFLFEYDKNGLLEDKTECLKLSQEYDSLSIEVSGERLLEAIISGKEKDKDESKEASEES